MSNGAGRLYIVATPIGNRDDITLRALEVLRRVDRVVAEDTRHSRRLLDYHGIDRPMLSLHEHNEQQAGRRVVELLCAGESLALVSDAGTPLISDPGFPLVRACRAQGVEVVPVPGACALVAALSVGGLPSDRFRFEGFPPRRRAARLAYLRGLSRETATLVFYEASHRIADTLGDLGAVFGLDRPAAVARELTKAYETVRGATLGELHAWVVADADQQRGEFVLLVAGADADAVRPDLGAVDDLLGVLLAELPVKQAAAIAARISGEKRNRVYRRALQLSRPP